MFEKIVTNALISPSLQKKLRAYTQAQRRIMKQRLILAVLSFFFLITQLFGSAYTQTTTTDSARGSLDTGGIYSQQALLARYDNEHSSFRNLAEAFSISREELEHTSEDRGRLDSLSFVEWSLSPTFLSILAKNDNGGPSFVINSPDGKAYYGHTVELTTERQLDLLYGQSKNAGNFAIVKQTGNFLSSHAAAIRADSCVHRDGRNVACPNNEVVRNSVMTNNLTYKTEAKFIKLHPGDQLMYSLGIHNSSAQPITLVPEIYLGDILEYTQLTDKAGGYIHHQSEVLSWQKTTIPAHQKQFYNFKVKVLDTIPLVAQSGANRSSYDCQLSTFFGNTYSLKLACPIQKVMERFLKLSFNPFFVGVAGLLFCINTWLYIRSYIMFKELQMVINLQKGGL